MAYDASREDRFTRDPARAGRQAGAPRRHEANTGWYWLFVLPFVLTLLPFIYNKTSPELIGIPFFYWYQTVWVVVTAVIVYVVYLKTREA